MRKRKIKKEIFLEVLPRKNKKIIDWNNSIGIQVKGIYDDIDFVVEIKSYDCKTSYLEIIYKDKVYKVHTGNFTNCQFGKIFGKITGEFKININQSFKDEKRNITIIDREYRNKKSGKYKYYKCHCNKCEYEYWSVEASIISQKTGCPRCCASPNIITEDYNSIVATDPWMIKYFQGGYDEAKKYSRGTHKEIYPICPNCGVVKNKPIRICTIYEIKSICCNCGDGFSYPEKFMIEMLNQLKIDFITQLSCKNFEWCNDKRYDFYIPSLNMIIETHGEQHYRETNRKGSRTLTEEQENDKEKKELALTNKITNYIIIDCRRSNIDFIKNNILSSELSKVFDLSKINWLECEEFALSSLIREVCEYYNEHGDMTTSEIGEVFGLTKTTIRKYLEKGTKLNWCNYNTDKEIEKARQKSIETNRKVLSKEVSVIKDGQEVIRFGSLRELNDFSLERLGIKLVSSQVCIRLNPEHKKYGELYKGFTFKYVS